jgi:hypothetical protein
MKTSKKFGKGLLMAMGGAVGVLFSHAALAAGIGAVATTLGTNVAALLNLLYIGSYFMGAVCGALSAAKLKAHNDNPQQTPMKTPVILFIVCAIFIGLPSYLQTAEDTAWNGTGQSSAARGGITR